jgi:hypothetical protein
MGDRVPTFHVSRLSPSVLMRVYLFCRPPYVFVISGRDFLGGAL